MNDIDKEIDMLLESVLEKVFDKTFDVVYDKVYDIKQKKREKMKNKPVKPKPEPEIKLNDNDLLIIKNHNIKDKVSCIKFLTSEIKQELKVFLNKPETKKRIAQVRKELIPELKDMYNEKPGYKFVCRPLNGDIDILEIVDGYQEERIEFDWIIAHLINTLESKYDRIIKYFKINLSGGDGDEGCIYF